MGFDRPIVIAVFGMSERELRLLQTICLLSANRSRTYEIRNSDAPQGGDFAVVDADDAQAMAAWRLFESTNPMLPVVMVGGAPTLEPLGYRADRPLMATRLLALFDRVELSNERPAFVPPKAVEISQQMPEAQPQAEPRPTGQRTWSALTALVVDDSLPVRRQIELELEPLVGQVDLAEDGERAIELIAGGSYDIVFLDVVLPGVDGYKICRTIKRDKRTKGTPVIMLTGKSSPFDRVKGKLAGCDTYLTKPVDHATFQQVVQQYLTQRK